MLSHSPIRTSSESKPGEKFSGICCSLVPVAFFPSLPGFKKGDRQLFLQPRINPEFPSRTPPKKVACSPFSLLPKHRYTWPVGGTESPGRGAARLACFRAEREPVRVTQ